MKINNPTGTQIHHLKCAALCLKTAADCFKSAAVKCQSAAERRETAALRRETCAEDEPQRGEIEGKSHRPKVERTSRERGEVAARNRAALTQEINSLRRRTAALIKRLKKIGRNENARK